MPSAVASTLLAAATHGSGVAAAVHTLVPVATVALVVTVSIALYLFTCLVWPFGNCKGAGKLKSPFGKSYRHCGKCDGSGLRVQFGRLVVNHIRATRGAGTSSTSKGANK